MELEVGLERSDAERVWGCSYSWGWLRLGRVYGSNWGWGGLELQLELVLGQQLLKFLCVWQTFTRDSATNLRTG